MIQMRKEAVRLPLTFALPDTPEYQYQCARLVSVVTRLPLRDHREPASRRTRDYPRLASSSSRSPSPRTKLNISLLFFNWVNWLLGRKELLELVARRSPRAASLPVTCTAGRVVCALLQAAASYAHNCTLNTRDWSPHQFESVVFAAIRSHRTKSCFTFFSHVSCAACRAVCQSAFALEHFTAASRT